MNILNILGGLTVDFVNAVYRGLLIKTYWVWFVMSTFPGVPSIGIPAAIGLSLLLTAMVGVSTNIDQTNSEILASGLGTTTLFFVAGWIVKGFM